MTATVSGGFHLAASATISTAAAAIGITGTTQFYNFETFSHPFVGELIAQLNQTSVADMLDPQFLGGLVRNYLAVDYTVLNENPSNADVVQVTIPSATIDIGTAGPYAVYNWELFFHIPVMIAVHLSQNQRFAEAEKWFHYVFDPTFTDSSSNNPPYPYWKFLGFRQPNLLEGLVDLLSYSGTDPVQLTLQQQALDGYNQLLQTPFDPYVVARSRPLAYMYNIVMSYLDNLIAWGDSLFLQNTRETINEARISYVLAANLLGPRPQQVPPRGTTAPMSYRQLKSAGLDFMGDAMVDMEVQFPFNNSQPSPQSGSGSDSSNSLFGIARTFYFCFPPNEKLLGYWDIVADRLFKIRNCESIAGVVEQLPLFDPPIDPGMLVKAAAAGIDIGTIVSGLNQPISPVRSTLLIQKAIEVANEVRSFGAALLSAYEKGDNEHLAILRQSNELAVQKLTQETRFLQWKQAQEATQVLLRTWATTRERYAYYLNLQNLAPDANAPTTFDISNPPDLTEDNFDGTYQTLVGQYEKTIQPLPYQFLPPASASSASAQSGASGSGELYLNASEDEELNTDLPTARDTREAANILKAVATALAPIPSFEGHLAFWGIGIHSVVTSGQILSKIAEIGAEVLETIAARYQDQAGLASRKASHQRRADEWAFQANLAGLELMQIGRQIIASLISEQVAKHEYNIVKTQVQQSQDVLDYIQNQKFTNEQLYIWMQGQLTSLYYQYYRLAVDTARKAEQTMKKELMRPELDQTQFIQFNYWNTGYQGLLSGEALHLDLKRMELAYYDNNKRELEMTRHVSLRQLNPMALLLLRTTGQCTFTIPEWFFDRECPGHYTRRIKTVALSLPSVVGPYTTVNCTLTLQSSTVRTSSLLKNNQYARQGASDDRFIDYFGSLDQIVTSGASNDSGMFETNLKDERFLPFEGSGAANSTWTLQLPQDFPPFDYSTIPDAILHLRYTARQGGDDLSSAAVASVRKTLTDVSGAPLALLFLLRNDFPTEWAAFVNSTDSPPTFSFTLKKDYFPYVVQGMTVTFNPTAAFTLYPADYPTDVSSQANATISGDLNKDGSMDISISADQVLAQGAPQVYLMIQYSAK